MKRAVIWSTIGITLALIGALTSYGIMQATRPSDDAVAGNKYEVGPPDKSELLELVNSERAKAGLSPLTEDTRLDASAQMKAKDMTDRSYFTHQDPSNPSKMNGVQFAYDATRGTNGVSSCSKVSENIYNGTGAAWTSMNTLNGWMGSKLHREALLDTRYTTTGFGIAGDIVVEHFCVAR